MLVWLTIILECEMAGKRCSNIVHPHKQVINMIWLAHHADLSRWFGISSPSRFAVSISVLLLWSLHFLLRHVKSAYPHASFISQISQDALFSQVSFFFVFHYGFISLTSWGWLWVQFSFILGLFEAHFMCFWLFHRIPQTIQDEVKHVFLLTSWSNCLRSDGWVNIVPFPFITTLMFALYWKRLFKSTRGLCHLKRFIVGDGYFFQEESFYAPLPIVHWTILRPFVFIDV